ncbi:metallophosphoesterase [Roseovarius pacificus]|uniref:metallophosphoesterase n=1 Tax=Roseovarius pacificus TaxID=337701 RepID=UPI002A18BF2E|nr:metallophosphoesterase [Roseovarius pacificus]
MTYDIIPDIHGQFEKLTGLLRHLGWVRTPAGWRNDDPGRQIVFLGDLIDRGPENAAVLNIVRSVMDAGKAQAVMGNHELNALHYHMPSPTQRGEHLRPHTAKNTRQHASFLREFPLGAKETRDILDWMSQLPLYLETESFRAVHACWEDKIISQLEAETKSGVLQEGQIARAVDETDPLFKLVDVTTKGPEAPLPIGYTFSDKDGTERDQVRVKWWQSGAKTWADLAMSVPDPTELPINSIPSSVSDMTYPKGAKPVFFGHYWLTGEPVLQAPNALCLDYSAGKEGPLIAYRIGDEDQALSPHHIAGLQPSI